jgi:U11/U12 small nuclear ribonucleoprotein 65 kDa protein
MNTELRMKLNERLNAISSSLHIPYPINSTLKYSYPPVNALIIRNIIHALICNKKFYTQVLHLMNKMSLPCPFESHSFTYQIPDDLNIEQCELLAKFEAQTQDKVNLSERMIIESTSEEESELESDTNEKFELKESKISKTKSIKVKSSLKNDMKINSKTIANVENVFDKVNIPHKGPIKFKISDAIHYIEESQTKNEGFGVLHPNKTVEQPKESLKEPLDDASEFASLEELTKNRLTQAELSQHQAYKNYVRGEPTCRLYIKNISKKVDELELKRIYGRFINWSNEQEKNMFDIRLMKEGRMKGQAFVTLPTEKVAIEALEITNGLIIIDKPIIVQFARSAKSK